MSNGIATSIALAGLAWLAACIPQAVPERPVSETAAAPTKDSSTIRYQVDSARGRVWWLTRDGVFLHDVTKSQRLTLVLPGWSWAGAPYSCLPDLALGPRGEAVITSDVVPTLWRIDPETLAVSVHPLALETDADKDVGFSGIVYSSEQGAFFGVSGTHGTLWMIDRSLTRAQEIPLSAPVRQACRIGMAARMVRQDSGRLCVRAPHKDWTIDLVPGQRAARVREAPCRDLPWQLSQLSLKGE
ncbi:MAG: hypothetical protein A3D95_07620 [Betaproteobacteria bacterium RIFCSPHIGHO2_12_FULL_69_13]|nr:MAG: hypothetical protein A3D95_07620 [Betaproteobacteria bacterium RIFCSPHIGHO2_12_FULL_69_13]OGA69835.1 MAG: hypothetical protein A3G83_16695 [Betaproteobacteria bacterium RIFCSPLOWO2_12_FULL_68_20]